MPTYDYRCENCETTWEVRRAMARRDDALPCADCGGDLNRTATVSMVAEVKGTGNGKIGRGLEDRAELGRKRRANWKGGL